MLANALLEAIGLILDGILAAIEAVVPADLLAGAGEAAQTAATVLQATPAAMTTLVVAAWFVIDTALNGVVFTISLYRLIPFKGT